MTESARDRNRRLFPEFADAVEFFRSKGAVIENAWVVKDGEVAAGRAPPDEWKIVWLDPEKAEKLRVDCEYWASLKAPRSWVRST